MGEDDLGSVGEGGGYADVSEAERSSDFTDASMPSEAVGYSDVSAPGASPGELPGGDSDPYQSGYAETGYGDDPIDTEYPAFDDPSLFIDRYGYVRRLPGPPPEYHTQEFSEDKVFDFVAKNAEREAKSFSTITYAVLGLIGLFAFRRDRPCMMK